jgi:hypothetical protein
MLLAVLLAAALFENVTRSATASQVEPDDGGDSIASTAVVAQGVNALPSDPIAWRVIRDTALAPAEAPYLERALGFAIAGEGTLLVTDGGSGAEARLATGEATFIPEAASQRHASLDGETASYLRIGLVIPEDATFTAGGELVLAGDAFAAPSGRRDIDLVRGEVGGDGQVELTDSGAPTLVLVTSGSVEVETGLGTETVSAGAALAFDGDLTLSAAGDGAAIFYAARIGVEVESGSGQVVEVIEDVDDDDGTVPLAGDTLPIAGNTAELWIFTRGCPSGTPDGNDFDTFWAVCTEPLTDVAFVLTAGGVDYPQTTQIDIAVPDKGIAVWDDLPAGAVPLTWETPAGYGEPTVFCRVMAPGTPYQAITNPDFVLILEEGDELNCVFFWPAA